MTKNKNIQSLQELMCDKINFINYEAQGKIDPFTGCLPSQKSLYIAQNTELHIGHLFKNHTIYYYVKKALEEGLEETDYFEPIGCVSSGSMYMYPLAPVANVAKIKIFKFNLLEYLIGFFPEKLPSHLTNLTVEEKVVLIAYWLDTSFFKNKKYPIWLFYELNTLIDKDTLRYKLVMDKICNIFTVGELKKTLKIYFPKEISTEEFKSKINLDLCLNKFPAMTKFFIKTHVPAAQIERITEGDTVFPVQDVQNTCIAKYVKQRNKVSWLPAQVQQEQKYLTLLDKK